MVQRPPLGWRARVGQDDRLETSATVNGRCDQFPIAGWGFGSTEGAESVRPADPSEDGGVGDRTLSIIGRAEPSGDHKLTDSIETSTDNLSLHKRTSR